MASLFKEYINRILMLVSVLVSILILFSCTLYLVLISLEVLFWRFYIYLLWNYVNQLLYALYFHLRGLQICSLVTLVNIWCQISIDQWRASIGLFYGQVCGHISIKFSKGCCNFKMFAFILCFHAAFAFLLLLKHGDVEIKPGPKKKKTIFFLFALEY